MNSDPRSENRPLKLPQFKINTDLITGATKIALHKKTEAFRQVEGTKDVSSVIFPLSHFIDSDEGRAILNLLQETGKVILISKSEGFHYVLSRAGFFKIHPDGKVKRRLANREILERFCNPAESEATGEQEPAGMIQFLIDKAEQLAKSFC